MTGSPISPSPCRGSAPAPSACSAPRSSGNGCKRTRAGKAIAAFALSEPTPDRMSPNIEMTATRDGDDYVLDGEKTWISNGGIADFYVVFARTGEAPGAKGLSAFLVPADARGLLDRRTHRGDRAASAGAHQVRGCARAGSAMIGKPGEGFKIAMSMLDVFRSTVGAAALGFARRALDETIERARDAPAVRRAAGRPADGAGAHRRHGARRRCGGAAGLSRRLDQGHAAPRASPARPRWPSCLPPTARRR